MSTRVYKQIGALIPAADAPHLLVDDASARLNAVHDEAPECLLEEFTAFVERHVANLPVSETARGLVTVLARLYAENGYAVGDLVQELMVYDDNIGFLFRNPGNVRASRRGNDIDYLENRDNLNLSVVRTTDAIHPGGGHRYVGPPDPPLTKLLESGVFLTAENAFPVACELNRRAGDKYHLLTAQHRCVADSGLFLPQTDPMMYLFALKLDLLRPGVTFTQFEQFARPSILTYWA
jgi:hypothetical protein